VDVKSPPLVKPLRFFKGALAVLFEIPFSLTKNLKFRILKAGV